MRSLRHTLIVTLATLLFAGCIVERCEWNPATEGDDPDAAPIETPLPSNDR